MCITAQRVGRSSKQSPRLGLMDTEMEMCKRCFKVGQTDRTRVQASETLLAGYTAADSQREVSSQPFEEGGYM